MAIGVVACTPLLTPEAQHQLSHVDIYSIPERMGQQLRRALLLRFGSECYVKKYGLKIDLKESAYSSDLGTDAKSILTHVMLTARYQLIRLSDQCILGKGVLVAHNQKTITRAYYSQTTADRWIIETNVQHLSRSITTEVARLLHRLSHPCCVKKE
jgi:hypothetical protein